MPNNLAYEFLRLKKHELTLNNDGLHYIRTLSNNRQFEMVLMAFKDKHTIKSAIHNKNILLDNDNIIIDDFR